MPEGCIAVVDAMGITDAGIFGDILCARMVKRGVAALVTDGVVRDLEGVLGTGLPVWCDGFAAPPSVAGLTFVGWGEPIGCGGLAGFPHDLILADPDGAAVIPPAFLELMPANAPGASRILHRHGVAGSDYHGRGSGAAQSLPRLLRAGRPYGLAFSSAGSDALCHLRHWPGSGQGRTDPRNPARRCRMDSAGR